MKYDFKKAYGVVATCVEFNNLEMRQVAEMRDRIGHVLNTHKDEKLKKEYLSDDELERIMTILMVISREYENCEQSAFDEALAELKDANKEENSHPKDATDGDEE